MTLSAMHEADGWRAMTLWCDSGGRRVASCDGQMRWSARWVARIGPLSNGVHYLTCRFKFWQTESGIQAATCPSSARSIEDEAYFYALPVVTLSFGNRGAA
jgi:hypothetical protein